MQIKKQAYGEKDFKFPSGFSKKITEEMKKDCIDLWNYTNEYFKDSSKDPYDWQIRAAVLLI